MARRATIVGFPAWLYDQKACWFKEKHCLWLCSGCGAPHWFKQVGDKHAGPVMRMKDEPWYSPEIGPCWRSKEYRVKCVTPKGGRVLYHEGYDPPSAALIAKITQAGRDWRRRENQIRAVPDADRSQARLQAVS